MISSHPDRPRSRRTALQLGSTSLAALLASRAAAATASASPSPLERQREIVQRLFADGVNAGDEAFIASLYAPILAVGASTMPAGAGMPLSLRDFRLAAPGVLATVETLVAEGDLVAALITWRGPHRPAGTHIEGHTMHLFHIEQDQIIEEWSAGWDWLDARAARKVCASANPLMTP